MKSHIRDGSLGSGSSPGKNVDEDMDLASGESVVDQKVAETLSGKSSFKDDSNHDLFDSEVMAAETSNASGADGKESFAGRRINKGVPSSLDETKQSDSQRIESRFDASVIEARSLSPGAEIKGPNQHPVVICDFYAKGWCIKGSSCRFLHVKDHQKNNLPQVGRDVPADRKREVYLEGLRENRQGSGSPNFHNALAASVGNKSAVSLPLQPDKIQPCERVESKGSHHFPEIPKFMSLQREELFALSFKDVGSEIKRQSGSANDYSDHGSLTNRDSSLFRDRFHPEYAVCSSHRCRNLSSHSGTVEETASFQQLCPHNYQIPSLSDSPNLSSSKSVSTTGTLPSNSISAWTGSSLPFSYSSLSTSHLGSISSSLLHCSSYFSGSKPDNLPPAKRKISSNDWEPSVPFRPSFLVRSMISLPGSLYDPLRDIVELPKDGDVSLKPSFYSQGSSIVNRSIHQNNGEAVSDTRSLACNDDTMSVSSHNTHHRKDMRTTEEEAVGTSTGGEDRTITKQENSLGSSAVKDITEATSDIRHQNQGPGESFVVKVGSVRQNNQIDAGHILDQTVNKESKALRQFRAALVDFVKDLLKPKWRDGHLSKAVHNKIVKKAVEKVLRTLPLEQIPTSMESVKQYLASSRGKIEKLVAGYAEIYGKV